MTDESEQDDEFPAFVAELDEDAEPLACGLENPDYCDSCQ